MSDSGRMQMKYVKSLLKIFPFEKRIPVQSLITSSYYSCHITNELQSHIAAICASDGSYAMVYSPQGAWFNVDLKNIRSAEAQAKWFDPRTGKITNIGKFSTGGIRKFVPPNEIHRGNDWVLLLKRI